MKASAALETLLGMVQQRGGHALMSRDGCGDWLLLINFRGGDPVIAVHKSLDEAAIRVLNKLTEATSHA